MFFNQVTGQFDPQQYAQALAQQNVTEADFEAEIRDQLAANHYGAAIYAGLRLPRIYGAVLAGQSLHTRDGSWFVVTPAMAGQAEPPTDEQLNAYLNENAAQLRRPEFRSISLVVFSPASEADLPPLTDEQIQERFEFRREIPVPGRDPHLHHPDRPRRGNRRRHRAGPARRPVSRRRRRGQRRAAGGVREPRPFSRDGSRHRRRRLRRRRGRGRRPRSAAAWVGP